MNSLVVGLQASRSDIGVVSLQRPDLSIWLELVEGLNGGLARRGSDDVVPFRTGLRRTSQTAESRPLVLKGIVSGKAGYRSPMDELLTIFRDSDEALVLVATLEDGSVRWVETWHPNVLAPDQNFPLTARQVSVEVSGEPYWHGVSTPLLADTGLEADTGLLADESGDYVFAPAANPDAIVLPTGSTDVEDIRVAIAGPSGLLSVSVVGWGFGFGFPALLAGQTLVVENGARTVTLNGVNARASLALNAANRHGEYLRLPRGFPQLLVAGAPALVTIHFDKAYE